MRPKLKKKENTKRVSTQINFNNLSKTFLL